MLDAIRAESFAQGVITCRTHRVSCGQLFILSPRLADSSALSYPVALTDEADLSTKEAQTCARPRIQDAHENPRGPRRSEAPPSKESFTAHTLST